MDVLERSFNCILGIGKVWNFRMDIALHDLVKSLDIEMTFCVEDHDGAVSTSYIDVRNSFRENSYCHYHIEELRLSSTGIFGAKLNDGSFSS